MSGQLDPIPRSIAVRSSADRPFGVFTEGTCPSGGPWAPFPGAVDEEREGATRPGHHCLETQPKGAAEAALFGQLLKEGLLQLLPYQQMVFAPKVLRGFGYRAVGNTRVCAEQDDLGDSSPLFRRLV